MALGLGGQQGRSADAAAGLGHGGGRAGVCRGGGQPRTVGARRTGRRCTRAPPVQPAGDYSPTARVRSNLEVAPGDLDRPQLQARAARAPVPGALPGRTRTAWNSGVRSRLRAGRDLLDQPLERHLLVGVGVEGPPPDPRQPGHAGRARPQGRPRSTRVLHEEADQPLESPGGCGWRSACPRRGRPGAGQAAEQRPGSRRAGP